MVARAKAQDQEKIHKLFRRFLVAKGGEKGSERIDEVEGVDKMTRLVDEDVIIKSMREKIEYTEKRIERLEKEKSASTYYDLSNKIRHLQDRAGEYYFVIEVLDDMPTIDAEIVVRCKDCKYCKVYNLKHLYAECKRWGINFFPSGYDTRTHFCAWGGEERGRMTREEAVFYIKGLQKTYASMDKKVAEAVEVAIKALEQDQKQGKWIEREDPNGDIYYDCSECGESFVLIEGTPSENLYNYCPNCGSRRLSSLGKGGRGGKKY